MRKKSSTNKETKGLLGIYHQRIQSKRSRTKARLHEQSPRMLQSILIYINQNLYNHVVDENYTSDCDFNSNINHEEKRQ